jgi:hypothetical protein
MLPSGPSYDALRAVGKPPKLALVAIMRKLLILAMPSSAPAAPGPIAA